MQVITKFKEICPKLYTTAVKICLTVMLAISLGCAPSSTHKYLPKSSRLYTNLGILHYAIEKSKSDGEKDLAELVHKSEVEEAWIFDTKKSVWYEVGLAEEQHSCNWVNGTAGIMAKLEDITLYHIHPIDNESKNYNLLLENQKQAKRMLESLNLSEKEKQEINDWLISSEAIKLLYPPIIPIKAFPSISDLMKCRVYGFGGAVVSEYGIVDYSTLTISNPRSESYSDLLSACRSAYSGLEELLDSELKKGKSTKEVIQAGIEEINKKLNRAMTLTFRSKDSLK